MRRESRRKTRRPPNKESKVNNCGQKKMILPAAEEGINFWFGVTVGPKKTQSPRKTKKKLRNPSRRNPKRNLIIFQRAGWPQFTARVWVDQNTVVKTVIDKSEPSIRGYRTWLLLGPSCRYIKEWSYHPLVHNSYVLAVYLLPSLVSFFKNG